MDSANRKRFNKTCKWVGSTFVVIKQVILLVPLLVVAVVRESLWKLYQANSEREILIPKLITQLESGIQFESLSRYSYRLIGIKRFFLRNSWIEQQQQHLEIRRKLVFDSQSKSESQCKSQTESQSGPESESEAESESESKSEPQSASDFGFKPNSNFSDSDCKFWVRNSYYQPFTCKNRSLPFHSSSFHSTDELY